LNRGGRRRWRVEEGPRWCVQRTGGRRRDPQEAQTGRRYSRRSSSRSSSDEHVANRSYATAASPTAAGTRVRRRSAVRRHWHVQQHRFRRARRGRGKQHNFIILLYCNTIYISQ